MRNPASGANLGLGFLSNKEYKLKPNLGPSLEEWVELRKISIKK